MKRLLAAAAFALGTIALVTPASAQIADAFGRPLPSPDMAPNSVSVLVIAGSIAKPVQGTEVTLTVNGTPRVARTDAGGHAFFKDLPAGATVQATVAGEDGKPVTSQSFPLPSDTGDKLILTTRPFTPSGGGAPFAPFAGGAGKMPEPRQMSGQGRGEQKDQPGTLTIRLTYDDFSAAAPVGVPVTVVGYHADQTIDVHTLLSDKDGRAQFTNLDRTGATSYFAMAQLPRNGAIDRLYGQPLTLPPEVGVRMLLSSAKRTATDPPIDDLGRIDSSDEKVSAGKLVVTLEGAPQMSPVSLIDVKTGKTIATAMPAIAPPDPGDIQASAQPKPAADVPAGSVNVKVHGGAGDDDNPLPGVAVTIGPAKTPTDGISTKTSADGTVLVAMKPAKDLVALITINGKQLSTKPFDVTTSGINLTVEAHWPSQGKPEATFDVTPNAGLVVYAQTDLAAHGGKDSVYRTLPVELVQGLGTHLNLYVLPRVMFDFHLRSQADDTYLVVGGQFKVMNNSWAPYLPSADGVLVPLPRGFVSAQVQQEDQADVSVVEHEGFRIVRAVPPGGREFHGEFALPSKDGDVSWHMDLPLGAFQSELDIAEIPGLAVHLPSGVTGQEMQSDQGQHYYVLPSITIMPRQSMEMTVSGLPAQPTWKVWVPRIIGVLVIGIMLGGLGFALRRSGEPADVARRARRAKLLDELVELDRSGKSSKRREAVLAELEKLWE